MKFNVEKLKQTSRPMTEKEKEEILFRRENREWLAHSERLALKLFRVIRIENITQDELAARMKISSVQLVEFLGRKQKPDLEVISQIENYLNQAGC